MKVFTPRYVVVIASIAVAGSAFLGLCAMNTYHMGNAAGVLTMQECLNCHVGFAGKAIQICTGRDCLYSKSHSLMHRYPPIGKETEYAPVQEVLSAGCVLEGGKITCLSCHDLTKPPPHLIRPGDKLCRICHLAQ